MDTDNNTTQGGSNEAPHTHDNNHNHGHNHDHNNKSAGESHTLMGVLSYLGPLVIISYLFARKYPFVKFHVKQGLVLFTIQIILWILAPVFSWPLWSVLRLLHLGLAILSIIGIINVLNKKEKPLPFVGEFSRYFTF